MNKALYKEQELLNRLAVGEREAVEEIYKQYHHVIVKWIRKHNGDENDGADIYQEAIVILYQKSKNEEFRLTCRVGTYLFAIARNLWYKKLQNSKSGVVLVPDNEQAENTERDYQDDINAHHERELHYEQLDNALQQLGEPCSSLLKAFYHKNKSMQDIAAEFGYTNPDNAKTQKYKCLTRLKKLFYSMQAK